MVYFYISFASKTAFLGATVVKATDQKDAFHEACRRKLNPGGEAMIVAIPGSCPPNMLAYLNRLVSETEIITDGGIILGNIREEVRDGLEKQAIKICESCNTSHLGACGHS